MIQNRSSWRLVEYRIFGHKAPSVNPHLATALTMASH